jgi:hypothetical protein
MQFLRELFRPSLKCSRIGHKTGHRERRGLCADSDHGVADSIIERQEACMRCDAALSPWEVVHSRTIHSLSMPSDDMDELRSTGRLYHWGPKWVVLNEEDQHHDQ